VIASLASNNITIIYPHPTTLQEYPLNIISFYPFLSCLLWILNRTVLITILFSPSFCFWTHAAVRRTQLICSYVWYIHNNIILSRYYIMFNKFQLFVWTIIIYTRTASVVFIFETTYNIISSSYNPRTCGRCAPYI